MIDILQLSGDNSKPTAIGIGIPSQSGFTTGLERTLEHLRAVESFPGTRTAPGVVGSRSSVVELHGSERQHLCRPAQFSTDHPGV